MNRGIAVFCHHTLRNQNRVFVVVAIPRHKGDGHVLTQRQFAQVSGSAIRNHITRFNHITHFNDWALVDVGVLVRTGVLGEVVDINTHFTSLCLIIIDTDHHTAGIHIINATTTTRGHGCARVNCHRTFDTSTNKRFFCTQARHSLTLHVRTHQGAVSIIVFQEWNQRSSHRHNLARCHIHVLHTIWRGKDGFTFFTTRDQLIHQTTFII